MFNLMLENAIYNLCYIVMLQHTQLLLQACYILFGAIFYSVIRNDEMNKKSNELIINSKDSKIQVPS